MSGFQQRDPRQPAFWDERFGRQFTPWDQGGVPAALQAFVQAAPAPLTTLIPGCGMAYELCHLADLGWDASAIDFAPAAVAAARAAAGPHAGRIGLADFFGWQPARPLDLIYERAFLCAMPRELWPRVAARWAALLPPGARLAGFFFIAEVAKGPPFGILRAELEALLAPHFVCEAEQVVSDSLPVFAGKERWMVWRRTGAQP